MHYESLGNVRSYFSGLMEQTFQTQMGVADPTLTDYLSDLMVRFVRWEQVYRVRDAAGKPLRQVTEMLLEAEQRVGESRRDVHRHVGDFTLFWTGVYPETLTQLHGREISADQWLDFCAQGKRSYWIASTIDAVDSGSESATAEILERLSRQFELCAYGLREVRREWERGDDDAPPVRPLLF
ncbi:MAG: hypothetical protein O2931_10875 [Planctomycetota bacterium]|nr:hypothetical protein [Planctomycetota bacterium]MDA1179286.1 hypothetical protein [Planctomycetota bacterium]